MAIQQFRMPGPYTGEAVTEKKGEDFHVNIEFAEHSGSFVFSDREAFDAFVSGFSSALRFLRHAHDAGLPLKGLLGSMGIPEPD